MTDLTLSPSPRPIRLLRHLGAGLGRVLLRHPRIVAIEALSRLSDAELAARGTTRRRELDRILGAQAQL